MFSAAHAEQVQMPALGEPGPTTGPHGALAVSPRGRQCEPSVAKTKRRIQ